MSEQHWDAIVIGGGSGGIAFANQAARLGAKVALINDGPIGGTCVNVGCVPKKLLWHAADLHEHLSHHARGFGIHTKSGHLDFETLQQNIRAYIQKLHAAYQARLSQHHVHCMDGRAQLIDANRVKVGDDTLYGHHLILAPGGHPTYPDIPGAGLGETSDDFFQWTDLPKSVGIAGAGYIAVELAAVLKGLGVEVHLFLRQGTPLRSFGQFIAEKTKAALLHQGVMIHDNVIPAELLCQDNEYQCVFENGERSPKVAKFIWAIGRTPAIESLHLHNVPIEISAAGYIEINAQQQTSVPSIFAVGDVTEQPHLTPAAISAARRLARRLFGKDKDLIFQPHHVASAVFTHPPVGTVGLSQELAIEQYGHENLVIQQASFTAMCDALSDHPIKTHLQLISLKDSQCVVGLHIIGPAADEMIQGFSAAMTAGVTTDDLLNTLAVHPTVAEEVVTLGAVQ